MYLTCQIAAEVEDAEELNANMQAGVTVQNTQDIELYPGHVPSTVVNYDGWKSEAYDCKIFHKLAEKRGAP